jgi:hypothetical protein
LSLYLFLIVLSFFYRLCIGERKRACSCGILDTSTKHTSKGNIMGKYFIAWLLGVPAFVLVLFYLFFH